MNHNVFHLMSIMNNKAVVASRNGPADHVDLVDKLQRSLKFANKVHVTCHT